MFNNETYSEWNSKRIKFIIDIFGHHAFHGKTVLDCGAGIGSISIALARLGADVLAVDARPKNIERINKEYPFIKTMVVDLDSDWPFENQTFDFVFSLATMEHLKNFDKHIRNICSVGENIILETEILDSNDPNLCVQVFEEKTVEDLSFHGEGSIVSATNIQNRISAMSATYKRYTDARLNSGPNKYNWIGNGAGGRRYGQRALWSIRRDPFFAKKAAEARAAAAANAPPQRRHDIRRQAEVFPQEERSPALIASLMPFTPSIIKYSGQTNTDKIRLIFNYYKDSHAIRMEEINFCLSKNKDNPLLDVVVVESADNPTYKYLFDKINSITGPNDVNIIAHSDIFFNETIEAAGNIKSKEVYALTCWEHHHPNNIIRKDAADSQDAWIIRGNIENVFGDFKIGKWGSDGRIAYEFHKAGYKVYNPNKSIMACHLYASGVKHHGTMHNWKLPPDGISGPHLFVLPTKIDKENV
jgi:SAM-dependent methyltransferase